MQYVFNQLLPVSFLTFVFPGTQIVPPNQAEMMYTAVKAKGLPAMYVLFKGQFKPVFNSYNFTLRKQHKRS